MIRNVPQAETVKKKVFVKIGRPGMFCFSLTEIGHDRVSATSRWRLNKGICGERQVAAQGLHGSERS